jgi:hypothetical protein
MGSLLRLIAVTVTANAPAALDGAAVKVSTERPPMVVVDGENDAVTPAGRPLTLSVTRVPARSAGNGITLAAGPLLVASQTHDPLAVAMAVFLQRLPCTPAWSPTGSTGAPSS